MPKLTNKDNCCLKENNLSWQPFTFSDQLPEQFSGSNQTMQMQRNICINRNWGLYSEVAGSILAQLQHFKNFQIGYLSHNVNYLFNIIIINDTNVYSQSKLDEKIIYVTDNPMFSARKVLDSGDMVIQGQEKNKNIVDQIQCKAIRLEQFFAVMSSWIASTQNV